MKRWTFFTLLIAGVVAARAQPGPGFALGFNGSGNYVAIPHTAAQDSMPMTVTAWVNTSQSTGQQGLVNKYVANSLNGWNVFLLDGHVRAWYFVNNTRFVWDGSNGLDGGFIADGFWHHVAFTVDASGGKLYVDGVVRDSRGWSGAAGQATTTQEVRLGNYPGGSVPFNGLLDEISIWDIALSQVSIQSFMTNSGLASDLLASYRCDEGFGLTVSDSSTVDGTNNGTWVGTAVFVSTTHITINVAWYRLGENDPGAVSGAPVTTTTTDIGRTNHLQQFGGPLYTNNVSVTAAARAGSSLAVQFNGTSQYLSNAIVPLPLDNFCIEAWVKANSVSAGSHIIAYNGDSTANGFGLLRVGGSYLGLLGSLAFVGSVPVTTNVWTHLALVRNNGLSRLYVNGAIASSSNNAGPVFPAGGFALAARPQAPVSEFFDGAIDEVRVFTFPQGQFRASDLLFNVAGFVADGDIVTINGIGTNLLGDITIGTNGSFTTAIITNGGSVVVRSDSPSGLIGDDGRLGLNATSRTNRLIVSGAGSTWDSSGALNLGVAGSGNLFLVTNGALARALYGFIGDETTSSNNVAAVTGPGSQWTNRFEIFVGVSGAHNQFVVSDGGTAFSTGGYLGANVSSSNNMALVTGVGSIWNNWDQLRIGDSSAGNQLVISDGGTVFATGIGSIGLNSAAKSNAVIVTDPNSVLTNNNDFYVGRSGAGNQLIVTNGAKVYTGFISDIGNAVSSSNNAALVTGTDSYWQINGRLAVGSSGGNNRLTVNEGAVVFGTDDTYIGYNSSANAALITGANSAWINGADLYVGSDGGRHQLVISNGAVVQNQTGYVGSETSSSNNLVLVTGSGSVWSNAMDLHFGELGAGNQLAVTNGALVVNSNGFVAFTASGSNNTTLITGAGSIWRNRASLDIGRSGSGNRLIVSNGGWVQSSDGYVGRNFGSRSNEAVITGAGSLWTVSNSFFVGASGTANRLVISDGGVVQSTSGSLTTSSNEVVITGGGSLWMMGSAFELGSLASRNRLIVSNGGVIRNSLGMLGSQPSAGGNNNEAVVTGPGSCWTNLTDLLVGKFGAANRLLVSNGGFVQVFSGLIVGEQVSSTNNRVLVEGGTLSINATNGRFDIRRGTNVLNAGLIEVRQLLLTNAAGFFEFNGGMLSTRNSTVSNGPLFRVGNGVSPAALNLAGNGIHDFTTTPAVSISSNAMLTGNGTLIGNLVVLSGATFNPGASIGKIILSNAPSLQGTTIMEISKSGSVLTNDEIEVAGTLSYNGSLVITNLGPSPLAAGDRFKLFNAATFGGSFTAISLPPLNTGLDWTNKLLVDGSIDVLGITPPVFTSIVLSGTNVIIAGAGGAANATYILLTATNIALPVTNWTSLATNQFGPSGDFSITNSIEPETPQRFYLLRTP